MKRFNPILSCALISVSLLAFNAQADDKILPQAPAEQSLKEVVVTATKLDSDVHTVGSSVTVISGKELENKQKSSLIEALRSVASLDVVQNGGTTSVFIRGAESGHTLVLLDGIELNDPSSANHSYDLSHMTVANIERVEIVRGPQSTLYGSDAMGGVINIITKQGKGKPTGSLSTEGGSFNTYNEKAGLSGGTDLLNYALGISRTDSDGISAASRKYGNHEDDGYENTTVSSRFGITPSANFQADAILRYIKAKNDLDNAGGSGGDDPNFTAETEQLFLRTQARLIMLDNLWEQKMGVSLGKIERDYQNKADAASANVRDTTYKGDSLKFDWQHNLYLTDANTLTFGLETEKEQLDSDDTRGGTGWSSSSSIDKKETRTSGYYVQDQISLWQCWNTTLGVRLDDHSRFGSQSTYRLASSYLVKPTGTRIKGSLGTGFKAPSLSQLYDPTYGNRELEPEKSIGWDFGVEQRLYLDWLSLELTYFDNSFRNMISYDPVTWQNINLRKTESHGVEVALGAKPTTEMSLRAGYTYTDTEDKSTGKDLLRRPKNKLFCDLDYRLMDKAHVYLGLISVGKRYDIDNSWPANTVTLKRYNLVNVALSYDVTEHFQLTARVDNLNDAHYEEVYGYGTTGRAGYAGVRMSF